MHLGNRSVSVLRTSRVPAIQGFLMSEKLSGHSSARYTAVSAVEGCPLSGVPLNTHLYIQAWKYT